MELKPKIIVTAITAMALANSPVVSADTSTWTGNVNTEWSNPDNWDGDVPDTASDTARFTSSQSNPPKPQPTNSDDISLGGLDFGDTVGIDITNDGSITFVSGGSITPSVGSQIINNNKLVVESTNFANITILMNTINANLEFNYNSDIEFPGFLFGTGTIEQNGSGKVTLDNSFASGFEGSFVIGNNATLQINDLNPTHVTIGDNGNLNINFTSDEEYGGTIEGTGNVVKQDSTTLTMTADNTYTGSTTVNGTLQLGDIGSSSGSVSGNIINKGNVIFQRTGEFIYQGVISNSGNFVKSGTGTLILTKNSTYNGSTIIKGGTVQFGNNTSTGILPGDIQINNNANLIFNLSNDISFSNLITGDGNVTQSGSKTLTFTDNQPYTGETIINNGKLQLGNNTDDGSVSDNIQINNNSELIFNHSSPFTFSQPINGSGTVRQAGSNTLIFDTDQSYGGTTLVDSGKLQLGNNTTTGTVATDITLASGTELILSHNTDFSFDYTISGDGNVVQSDNNTLTFTADNNYSGSTTVNGTLELSTGSVSGNIINYGNVLFERPGTFIYNSVISESGSLTKSGTGTLVFTKNQTYSGDTTIDGGVLQLGNDTSTGTVTSTIQLDNNSELAFKLANNNLTFSQPINGSGTVRQAGSNTLIFDTNQSYGGTTLVDSGKLQLGNNTTTGTVATDITLASGTELILSHNTDFSFDHTISGDGNVVQSDSNILTFSVDNDYSGSTTVNGTLELSTGSVSGDIINYGSILFERPGTFRYESLISESGTLTKSGSGTLVLTQNNPYTGKTTISDGTLQLGDNTETGLVGGDIQIDSSGTLIISHSDNLTYQHNLDGSGSIIKNGDGSLTIVDNSSFSGTVQINDGSLIFSNSDNGATTGNMADANISIASTGSLFFNRSNEVIFNGVIDGEGTVTQSGTGTLIFTQNQLYTGDTNINNGKLQLGNNTDDGSVSGSIQINNNSELIFNHASPFTFSQAINGSGIVRQSGSDTLIFDTNQNYVGSTIVDNGTLQLGNNTKTGMVSTDIELDNDAAIIFNRSDNLSYENSIFGNGKLIKENSNTLTFIQNNQFRDGVEVNAGAITYAIIADDFSEPIVNSDNISLANNTIVNFNHTGIYIADGVISGNGSVNMTGTGVLVMNQHNTYDGETTIESGLFRIGNDADHSTAAVNGNVTVNNGSVIGGFGTIFGNLNLNDSAIVSPGASIGTLTITGDYQQPAGTTYFVEIDKDGNSDLLQVSNTATIEGSNLLIDMREGFDSDLSYVILSANEVVGKFDNINILQVFLSADITYSDNSVSLVPFFESRLPDDLSLTPNQQAVGRYLFATGSTPEIQTWFASLTSEQQARQALDQISGATYADQQLQLAYSASRFTEQLANRTIPQASCTTDNTARKKNDSFCSPHPRLWTSMGTTIASIKTDNVSGLDTDSTGVMLGFEFPALDQLQLGTALALNYFDGHAQGNESANDEGMLNQFALYGDYHIGHFNLSANLIFGITDNVNVSRQLDNTEQQTTINGEYKATLFSQHIDTAYYWKLYNMQFGPVMGLSHQSLTRDAFDESGNMGFALSVQEADYHSLTGQLGMVLTAPIKHYLSASLSAKWQHEFADSAATVDAAVSSIANNSKFSVSSASIGRDMALLQLGVTLFQQNEIRVATLYQGAFADGYDDNGVWLEVDFDFG